MTNADLIARYQEILAGLITCLDGPMAAAWQIEERERIEQRIAVLEAEGEIAWDEGAAA